VLAAASAAAAAVVLVAGGCGGKQQAGRAPPSPTTTSTTTTTSTAAPTTTAPGIADLHASRVSPFSVKVAWETRSPTAALLAAGPPGGPPTLWRREAHPATHHSISLSGLSFSTPYRIRVTAAEADAAIDMTTAPAPANPRAVVRGGVLWVDGSPFFPLMVFEQCPDTYSTSLQAGITLFAGNRCGGLPESRPALLGKALLAASADDHATGARGTVGTFFPDEADGHHLTGATLPVPPPGGAGIRFLTLTNHFYSGSAALPRGRTIYPGLVAKADVVGFDLYPLQGWCRPDRLADVFWSQHELAQLAYGRPTFQWIEAAGMRCPDGPTAVTPATTRGESFLAIAGGARGLGYFPAAAWTGDVGAAISGVSRAVRYLGPGLLGPAVPATTGQGSGPVLVGARAFNGAMYVVAVNPSYLPAHATVTVRGLGGRALTVFDETRTVASSGDTFEDDFAPLAAHVYVAAPS
jgi:hypothetical protein